MSYPVLSKKLLDSDCLVFFDFEATQFSHHAIAIGVYAVRKKPGTLFSVEKEPLLYHGYIQTKENIGPVVKKMTGITPELLEKEGKSIHETILDISKLLRPYKNKKYLSYGNMDIRILLTSIHPDDITENEFYRHVSKNYFDFHHYLEKRIVDMNGQSLSVAKLTDLFSIHEEKPHDPLSDARDLALIYQSYVEDEERAIRLVMEHYDKNPYISSLNKKLVSSLLMNGSVTKEELRVLVKEYL